MTLSEGKERRRWWAWMLGGLVAAGLVVAGLVWGRPVLDFLYDRERVSAFVAGLGPWGPAGIFLLEMLQALLAPIPGTAIELVSGFLYGPWLGALYAMAGLVTGALVAFLLARRFGRPLVLRFVAPRAVSSLDRLLERGGSLLFFVLWLLPFVPDDLVCLAAGLIGMPTRRFVLLMAAGRLPGILFSTWLGANLTLVDPVWGAILLAAAVLVAVGVWLWGERMQQTVLQLAGRLRDRFRR